MKLNPEKLPTLTPPSMVGLLKKGFHILPETLKAIENRRPTIDLLLNARCSHQCYYCASGMQHQHKSSGILDEIGGEKYLQMILALAGEQTIHYSFGGPGECSEHPAFEFLLRSLIEKGHYVTVQTHGLNSKKIQAALSPFPKELVAERVDFNLSFHYGAYLNDKNDTRLKAYVNEHFPRMASLGALIALVVPLSPQILHDPHFEGYLAEFATIAARSHVPLYYCPLELHGAADGKTYPRDYTTQDRARITELMARYPANFRKGTTGDQLSHVDHLYLKGMPCYARSKHLILNLDGTLADCQESLPLEIQQEIMNGTRPAFIACEPKACQYDRCTCVGAGFAWCLTPLGISISDYVDELQKCTGGHPNMVFLGNGKTSSARADLLPFFVYAFVQERFHHLLATKNRPLAIFPFGNHTKWLLSVLDEVISTDDVIVFDDSLTSEQRFQGYRCLPSSQAKSMSVQTAVLSTDQKSEGLMQRAKVLFDDVIELYDSLPHGPYVDKAFML